MRECGLIYHDGLMQYGVALAKDGEGCIMNKDYVIVYKNKKIKI